jgi:hypothetical protein
MLYRPPIELEPEEELSQTAGLPQLPAKKAEPVRLDRRFRLSECVYQKECRNSDGLRHHHSCIHSSRSPRAIQ